jgi:hypothetical protein
MIMIATSLKHLTKALKILGYCTLWSLAIYGGVLGASHLSLSLNLTREAGAIDANSDYFNDIQDKYSLNFRVDSASMRKHRYEILERIQLLNDVNPTNAQLILNAYLDTHDERLVLRMLDAADFYLTNNAAYQASLQEHRKIRDSRADTATKLSVFEWMNIEEWMHLKSAIVKHRKWIDSAAHMADIEPRMVVACLVGEQVRKFNSRREKYKGLVAPLKSLSLSTQFSYGVTGIKEHTARMIEQHLKDSISDYYCGKQYEHLLDYDTTANYVNKHNDTLSVRVQRLTQFTDHYYPYLYTALFLKQIMLQWERAGHPISDRPEILATIFNLGFVKSKPKSRPEVGGSVFNVRETTYTFGAIAYEFYYSGELAEAFPFRKPSLSPSTQTPLPQ